MDVVDTSQRQLMQFKQQIKSVEGLVSSTNTSLSNYPTLKGVKHARDNLQTVIEQVLTPLLSMLNFYILTTLGSGHFFRKHSQPRAGII